MNKDIDDKPTADASSVAGEQAPTASADHGSQTPLFTPPPKPKRKKIAALIVLLVLVFGGSGAFAAILLVRKNQAATTAPTTQTTSTPTSSPTTAASLYNWLDAPKVLDDQKLLVNLGQYYETSDAEGAKRVHYYEVGSQKADPDTKVLLVTFQPNALGEIGDLIMIGKSGSYQLPKDHNASWIDSKGEYDGPTLASSVKASAGPTINELTGKPIMAYNGGQLVSINSSDKYPTSLQDDAGMVLAVPAKGKLVSSGPDGKLYQVTTKTYDYFSTDYYYLVQKDFLTVRYRTHTPVTFNGYVPDITFSNGTKNIAEYNGAVVGCGTGAGSNGLATAVTSQTIQKIGTTSDGAAIYALASLDDPLFSKVYADYTASLYDAQPISKQQFQDQHGYFLIQDDFKNYVLYLNSNLIVAGGCAKPVVYLYPTKTTKVSVKVGADVTVSDPAYGNGWTVTANPSGQLTTASGQAYRSLLWEGYGDGLYPDVTSGTIVKSSDAVATIKRQLHELNLTDQESADFLAYWTDKLPKTPYVRLTWFTTADLQRLAPLSISPQPDTMLRVFLDFEGLQAPYSLPAQKLTATVRKGFTVVEWGGLLRSGL